MITRTSVYLKQMVQVSQYFQLPVIGHSSTHNEDIIVLVFNRLNHLHFIMKNRDNALKKKKTVPENNYPFANLRIRSFHE